MDSKRMRKSVDYDIESPERIVKDIGLVVSVFVSES